MSTALTLRGLMGLGVNTTIVMSPLRDGDVLRANYIPVIYNGKTLIPKIGYVWDLKECIRKAGDMDIYHAQGVWQYNTYALADVAREKGRPYIITPRGMLYPQDIAKNNTFFKRLSLKWRLLDDLNRAACVHVTCEEEMRHCRELGVTSPMAVIPNPVEIKDYPYRKSDDVVRLGYLGRVSRRKNIESLIYAFADLRDELRDAELLIIGGGDDNYEQFLKAEVERLGLKNVCFAGFLSGEAKDKALASCSVLAMPSEFENLGNVILEGLVRGIPCIATKGSPWQELEERDCGWWVDYSQQAITEAVRKALTTTQTKLSAMGRRGRQLMEEKYSVEAVGAQMKALYEWAINGGESPRFVHKI